MSTMRNGCVVAVEGTYTVPKNPSAASRSGEIPVDSMIL